MSDDGDVVSADDVQAQDHLFDAVRGREDPFVGVVQDDIDRLVEAFERAHEVAAIRSDDGHGVVHVRVQARCHCDEQELWRDRSTNLASVLKVNRHSRLINITITIRGLSGTYLPVILLDL